MSEELKPCPFCGSHDIMMTDSRVGWYVLCRACQSSGSPTSEIEAIKCWNTRHTPELPTEEEIEKALTEKLPREDHAYKRHQQIMGALWLRSRIEKGGGK